MLCTASSDGAPFTDKHPTKVFIGEVNRNCLTLRLHTPAQHGKLEPGVGTIGSLTFIASDATCPPTRQIHAPVFHYTL